MDTVIVEKTLSRDGTQIACHRSGTGPPLILVPGSGAANPMAWPAYPTLAQHFTIYAMDRRGRGQSGDSSNYALEREFEDVAAVVDAIGEPAHLLGHSAGGLLALEAALLTRNIHRLVVYEPAISDFPEGLPDRLQAMVDAGNSEGMWMKVFKELVGLSDAEIKQFKESPAWPERLAAARTFPREMRAAQSYRYDPQRFTAVLTPTLLLAGSESQEVERRVNQELAAVIPDCRMIVMPGQAHIAMYTSPDLFVQEVLAFLTESR